MNRTIKFRGKRLDNGEWITGSETFIRDADGLWLSDADTDVVKVSTATVGQYFATLPDGTELYEGDRVLIKDSVEATVVWSGHGFHIYGSEDVNGRHPDYTLSNPMKKIGTIYDKSLNGK